MLKYLHKLFNKITCIYLGILKDKNFVQYELE